MSRRKKSENSGFNIWRSYSDMMCGVLLLFVLIMSVTLLQAQKSYADALKERDEKIALQEEYTAELLAKQAALDQKEDELELSNAQLADQDEQLSKQQMLLAEMDRELKAKEAQLEEQQKQLEAQAAALETAQIDLDEKTNLLNEQQRKIDNIIGVKAEVVESLQDEFAANNMDVNIDSKTGALTLQANIMFATGESTLTEEGEVTLYQVLPIYCKVLLQDEYRQYLAEITIDGYTDDVGDYAYNLRLSEERAYAVAEFLLSHEEEFLTETERNYLREFLVVNGHSMGGLVVEADGTINQDASRRVEIKFRLKDDEMISELSSILAQTGQAAAE